MKQLNYSIRVSGNTTQWGSWSEFKRDYLHYANEYCKKYHGDIFFNYELMTDCIDKAQQADKPINCLVSFHESGSDFIDKTSSDTELIEMITNRIASHKGVVLQVIKTNNNDLADIWIYDNKFIK